MEFVVEIPSLRERTPNRNVMFFCVREKIIKILVLKGSLAIIGVFVIGFVILRVFIKGNTTQQHNLKYMRHRENGTSNNECTRIDRVDDGLLLDGNNIDNFGRA